MTMEAASLLNSSVPFFLAAHVLRASGRGWNIDGIGQKGGASSTQLQESIMFAGCQP